MASTPKHLVLEDDVHRTLKAKKGLAGLSIREIGNAVLRSSMDREHLPDIVGDILVGMGRLSEDEYRQVLEQAAAEAQRIGEATASPVTRTREGTLVSGSWEMENVLTSRSSLFQILECWARDGHRLPMEAHRHDADEFVIALRGRTLVTMNGVPVALGARNMLQIPAGCVHSGTPLDGTAHVVVVVMPPIPEYRS